MCQTAFYTIVLSSIVFASTLIMPFYTTRIAIFTTYTYLILSPIYFVFLFPPGVAIKTAYFKDGVNGSLFHRILAWEFYSKKFFEQPFFGWGAESARYIPTEENLANGYSNVIHPHHGGIQAFLELGLAGGILYALFFASLFLACREKR